MSSYYYVTSGGAEPTAWLALFLSLCALGWGVWVELTGHRRRRADEYWYRGIFSPQCVEPLIEFLNEHVASLQRIDCSKVTVRDTRKFCDDFSDRKEKLLSRIWISKLFSPKYYDVACDKFDEMEDNIAKKLGGWVLKPSDASPRDLDFLANDAIEGISGVLAAAEKVTFKDFSRKK